MTEKLPSEIPPPEMTQEFDDLRSLLDAIILPTASPDPAALTELDRRISAFCDKVAALPPPQARQFVEPLHTAVTDLDGLAKQLEALTEQARPNPPQSSRQAAKAYGKKSPY